MTDNERERTLREIKDTEAYKVLREQLTDDQIIFVWNTLHDEYCGMCWGVGPYCCYDSVIE